MDIAVSNINAGGPIVPAIQLPGPSGNNPAQKESSAMTSGESRSMSSEEVKKMLANIQSQLESMNIGLSFSTYGDNGRDISIVVTDKDSGKVIREIPAKELQNLYTKLGELIGIIFNHSV
ncbi:MAG: flagellar protein FlaG [Syntrophaceae bacterium]